MDRFVYYKKECSLPATLRTWGCSRLEGALRSTLPKSAAHSTGVRNG